MKKNFLGFCAILILLVSCGPTIRVGYNYAPPDDSEGRSCVAQCHIQKQKCEQRADSDYYKCSAEHRDVHVYDSATRTYRTYSSAAGACQRYNCVESYNECFRLCGGMVESYVYEEQ
jgi:hypothetical protein